MRVLIVSFAVALTLGGCLANRIPLTTEFNANEVAFALAPGTGNVAGQAFYNSGGGNVTTPDGQVIILIPKSAYSRELVEKVFRGRFQRTSEDQIDIANYDQRMNAYIRRTVVGPGGTFLFAGVPAGHYYVVVVIKELQPALLAGYNPRERVLVADVNLGAGETARVSVSR